MTPSRQWFRPRFAAQWWGPLPRLGAAAAILCAVCLVASAEMAQGGINVSTGSNGGPPGLTYMLAIDPQTSTTLYAGAGRFGSVEGVYKSTD